MVLFLMLMPAYQSPASWEKRNRRGFRNREALQHWQKVPDLAGIRDPAAIAKLPGDEQETCKKHWADVAALLKKVLDLN
jgi:hypothetical protein